MRIERTSTISHPLRDVIAWHQRPGALVRMCPPGLGSVGDPRDGGIEDGKQVTTFMGPALLGDRVRPRWVLRHERVQETATSFSFEDTQVSGPFRSWRHHHEMTASADGTATVLRETIDLALPVGIAEKVAAGQVDRMLGFRAEQLQADLDLHARLSDRPRLVVAVSGATGFIGTQVVALLETGGHTVRRMVRGEASHPGDISWDPADGRLDPEDLAGVDAVVNLSGRSIATRLTPQAKREILDSRTQTSSLIARTLSHLAASHRDTGPSGEPRALVQASAIGYYGAQRPSETLGEGSAPGTDFLAQVCVAWERAMAPATEAGVRTVALRTGIVLSDGGGALLPQLPLFLAGAGGRLWRSDAVLSWITLDDMARAYVHALLTPSLTGPVNAVAPQPVGNGEFARTMGRVLRRPSLVPVPPFGPELLLGREGAKELVQTDQDVESGALRASAFTWANPSLEGALRHVLRR